jgi:hypothetical protein
MGSPGSGSLEGDSRTDGRPGRQAPGTSWQALGLRKIENSTLTSGLEVGAIKANKNRHRRYLTYLHTLF